MNMRRFPRVRFNTDASIVAGGEDCFNGRLENMSLSGCFIRTEHQVRIGESADITLPTPTVSMPSGIKFKGTVIRVEGSGIAYSIRTIDYDTFTLLKAILKNKITTQLATCLLSLFLYTGLGDFVFLRRGNSK